jgi:hypothetical protein
MKPNLFFIGTPVYKPFNIDLLSKHLERPEEGNTRPVSQFLSQQMLLSFFQLIEAIADKKEEGHYRYTISCIPTYSDS